MQEVAAARTIAKRGVALVATAHGADIHSLMDDHVLQVPAGMCMISPHPAPPMPQAHM